MELQNWLTVLFKKSSDTLVPAPIAMWCSGTTLLLFGDVALPVTILQHLQDCWPCELVCSMSAERVYGRERHHPNRRVLTGELWITLQGLSACLCFFTVSAGAPDTHSAGRGPDSTWDTSVQGSAPSSQLPRELCLLPCNGWERGCESQVGLGAEDTGNGLFRELGWKENSSQEYVISAQCWRGIRCSQPGSRSLSLPVVAVCLLSYCLGIVPVDNDLCYGWNCVNIWYLPPPPFSSHPPSNTVSALSVEHGVTGRSKQLEGDRKAIFVTTLIHVP